MAAAVAETSLPPTTGSGATGAIQVEQVLAQDMGDLSASITHLRFTGYDGDGTPQYGPVRRELAPVVILENVPVSVVLLQIEYLNGFETVGIGDVEVEINPNQTEMVVNPPFQLVTLVLTDLEIAPADRSIARATTQEFIALATLADGIQRDVTELVIWGSSDEEVASITNRGVATGLESGTTTISAFIGALRGTTTLIVGDATLDSIAVNPSNSELVLGGNQQLGVVGTLTDNTTQDVTPQASFSSSNTDVASVSQDGVVTAHTIGEATITATVGEIMGETTLTVVPLEFIQRDSGAFGFIEDVAFGNNLFVAVVFTEGPSESLNTFDVVTSSDGVNWRLQRRALPFRPLQIAFGNGIFVAFGYNGGIATSPDGINWTDRSLGTTRLVRGAFGNGVFVAGTDSLLYTSVDGVTWTQRTTPWSPDGTRHVYFGRDLFVLATTRNTIATSSDGINWTERNVGARGNLYNGYFGNGRYFFREGDFGLAPANTLTSTDGITWNRLGGVRNVAVGAFGRGVFLDTQNVENSIAVSTNGTDWSLLTVPDLNLINRVIFAQDRFVVVCDGGLIFTSP